MKKEKRIILMKSTNKHKLDMYLPPTSTIVDINPMSMVYDAFPPSPSPSNSTIQQIIQDIFLSTRLTIQQMETLSGHLHRISMTHLSNASQLTLKLSPSTTTPVLQHERYSLESEAAILSHLSKTNLPIPRVLKYDKRCHHLGSPYLLTTTLPGISYASVLPYLTRSEREDITRQIHALRTHISSHTSPHGTFGPAAMIAVDAGLSTWREAFKLMMDTILMDGENVTVNLPYIEIRAALAVHLKALDEVRESRLVVLGVGRSKNVLIERRTNDVTGLLDFGQALWGDVGFGEKPGGCGGARGLL